MTVDATPPPLALAALEALRRARLRAIEVARATNTCLVVYRDGKVVLIPPEDLPVEKYPTASQHWACRISRQAIRNAASHTDAELARHPLRLTSPLTQENLIVLLWHSRASRMRARDVPAKFQVAFSFSGMEREFVRSIADAVELRLGSPHVFFDEWFEHHVAGHDAELKLQRIYETGCELVVVCVSETYARKAWAQTEHEVIRARLMQARTETDPRQVDRILPIRVGDGNVQGIPINAIVPDVRARTPGQIADLILARWHLVTGAAPPAPGPGPSWPAMAPAFTSRLADRASEWPAVVRLLSVDATRRVLVFKGPSNFGKSALLGEARRYARDCLKVPVAYLDFKDTMLLTEHNLLRELKTRAGDALPGFAQAAQTDRWALLQALRQLSRPLLLVLDTYEKVTEARDLADWIETQLMPEVEDCPELRVLIAGQKGPDLSRARWRGQADELELDRIHSAETWTAWIREQNPVVEEKHVQGIVLALEGVPGSISGLLVTLARRAQSA